MATVYDMNYLRQIEAGDSEFNKAQKADNMHNIQTNIALNGYTGNIDLANRPVVRNADGTNSTVRSMSFNEDGKEILIPTISQNGTVMNPQQAIDEYHRTGQHLGMFNSPEEANAMAQQIHNQQAQMYGNTAPQATPNPENDPNWYLKVNHLPMKATQAVAQGNNPSFNAQAVTNTAIANLMKKGYSHDEAVQMLSPYITEWQNREAQEKKAKADDLMTQMGNMEFGSKDYYNAALQMYQLDPERGQMLLRGAVTPRDIWTRENRLADLADQRAYQAMYGRGRGGGGGRSGGGGGGGGRRGRPAAEYGGMTTTQYNMMTKIQGRLEKQIQALRAAGKEVPASLQQRAMAIDSALERYEMGAAGLLGNYADAGIDGSFVPGMTKEQMANGIQNVIWDDGLKAGGPSDDAIEYLLGKLPKGATREKIKAASDALYNAAGNAEDADAALLGSDVPLQVRQQQFGEGMNEASRRGYKVDLDGTIYGASEEFKNKYPNLKYGGGTDYYKGLLAEYGEDE